MTVPPSASVEPVAFAVRSFTVVGCSGVTLSEGAVGRALIVKLTKSEAVNPSVSVAFSVTMCSPKGRSLRMN